LPEGADRQRTLTQHDLNADQELLDPAPPLTMIRREVANPALVGRIIGNAAGQLGIAEPAGHPGRILQWLDRFLPVGPWTAPEHGLQVAADGQQARQPFLSSGGRCVQVRVPDGSNPNGNQGTGNHHARMSAPHIGQVPTVMQLLQHGRNEGRTAAQLNLPFAQPHQRGYGLPVIVNYLRDFAGQWGQAGPTQRLQEPGKGLGRERRRLVRGGGGGTSSQ
jgi:hypothetical protein